MKAICICTSNRPVRFAECLRSILRNGRSLGGWKFYISQEPGNPEVTDVFFSMPLVGSSVTWVNPRALGPTLNTFMAYNAAFNDGAEAVLYMDDDMVVSPDAIDLCNWYLDDRSLSGGDKDAGLCLCNKELNDPSRPNSIATNQGWVGLVGQGYCITAPQWFNWVKRIFFSYKPHFGGDDYDWAIAHTAVDENRRILRPRFSRSQHTGTMGWHGAGVVFPDQIANHHHYGNFVIEEE